MTRELWFRVGRSNPRNIYQVTDSENWKEDIPVGSMYEPHMGEMVADALNFYMRTRSEADTDGPEA